jgi:gamma-glutamylcyclotransferase (GGCT)/AIG2-like uncharacterized protein YtfP
MYYFAYGSNLHTPQLVARIGAAKVVGAAMLRDYELVFSGHSRTRGGATASIRPKRGSDVPGVVLRVTQKQIETMDRFEGHPTVYKRFDTVVELDADEREIEVTAYRRPDRTALAAPTIEYFTTVLRGYRDHGLDETPLLDALLQSVPLSD